LTNMLKLVIQKQLKRYELWGNGKVIHFSEIDETLPSWVIIKRLHSACWD